MTWEDTHQGLDTNEEFLVFLAEWEKTELEDLSEVASIVFALAERIESQSQNEQPLSVKT